MMTSVLETFLWLDPSRAHRPQFCNNRSNSSIRHPLVLQKALFTITTITVVVVGPCGMHPSLNVIDRHRTAIFWQVHPQAVAIPIRTDVEHEASICRAFSVACSVSVLLIAKRRTAIEVE